MSSNISWINEDGFVVGWGYEEEGKVDWFACRGNSEEIKEIKEEIHKFKLDKNYSYFPDEEIEVWGKCEKYTIHNEELKKKLWELLGGEIEYVPKIEMPEILKPLEAPSKLTGLIKPIKPIKPLRPLGRPKENEKWKKYKQEIDQYKKEINNFYKEIEDYNREIQGYNEEIKKHVQEIGEKFGEDNKKLCFLTHKQNSYSKNSEPSKKNEWRWREFWIGCGLTLVLSVVIFALFKLFKKKK